jgi:cytidyltransferase-like protein
MSKQTIGIVSGYFNPIHLGHIDYLRAAYEKCDSLYTIVNNDKQVELKGACPFYDEETRVKLVKSIRYAGHVIKAVDDDESVAKTIEHIVLEIEKGWKPLESNTTYSFIFFNGGDRPPSNWNKKEVDVCLKYNVSLTYLPMPKVDASSDRVRKAAEWYNAKALTNEKIELNKQRLERAHDRIKTLEECIRKHRDSWINGDDKCWKDNEELYKLLPEGFTPPEGDESVELWNCIKYLRSCHHPSVKYESPQVRIEELEIENNKLKEFVYQHGLSTGLWFYLNKTKEPQDMAKAWDKEHPTPPHEPLEVPSWLTNPPKK